MKCPGVQGLFQFAFLPDSCVIHRTRLSDVHEEEIVVGINQGEENDAKPPLVVEEQAAWKIRLGKAKAQVGSNATNFA